MRILVVDDNRLLADVVTDALREAGFVADHAGTLAAAADAAAVAPYDAFLVDRVLPDGDGLDWIRAQRRSGNPVPALIITAERDEVDHRVEGLNAGADDYIVKPIPLDELVARLRAVLRRPANALDPVLRAGNVEFNPVNREVSIAGRVVTMPRRETCIFEMLMRRAGKTVAKGVLEEGLYSFESEVSSNAIEVGVYRLRGHLAGAGANLRVRTVRGTGYMLEAPESPIEASAIPAAALMAAQVAVALTSDAPADALSIPAVAAVVVPAVAASMAQPVSEDMKVATVAAAIAVTLTKAAEGGTEP